MGIPIDPTWLEVLLLATVRMTAFLIVAPPFAHHAFPARIKAMLGLGLGLAVSQRVAGGYAPRDTAGFLTGVVLELITGLALGFLVMVIFAAIQSAGSLIDLFSGFQMAQAFDPQMMVNGAQFTRLLQMAALALLFASDGYQLVITGLTGSFAALPLAGGIDLGQPVQAMTTAVTGMFLAAVQIAGPLIVVLFLADVGLGLLTRVAPALNAFSLGFPLKILMTLALAGFMFLALPRIVSSLAGQAAKTVLGVG
ncbi:flagellar biosynthetic protein FliR [Arthrobacter sp. V4I6]|uniref:flagellar biosynthetic protein FliR n=1 Tax=unclassified Arthrobacter TaxID=235627 RepID=UPI00277FF798|nr:MULTISPECIES: flagellar biosynthetic protein FliR [unclassified Arthrobacter]MDQ0822668.1 flagellar biosynthetic protein FliR [Arthrobacter sp. V1I7]MDQ0852296.1 flagellar biosynthetic protein FliR [Arthrobacter sp. V4I6]